MVLHLVKQILYLLLLSPLLVACNQVGSNSCGSAWVGGQIVNPKQDFVVLSQSRRIIDTIYLDENNFFKYQLEGLDPGVFFFSHFEYQAMYIEPGDSIMFRVNTMEFDESLTFTGKGAGKNNLMMELFLINEQENSLLPKMYKLEPREFEHDMDSLKHIRMKLYEDFVVQERPSKGYKEVVRASIDYDYYSKKELYIAAKLRRQQYDTTSTVPESFYDYRKKVDLGSEALRGYYPYYRYVGYYMDNLAYEQYMGKQAYDRDSYLHSRIKLELIDSLVTNDSLRNSLLRTTAARYFLNAQNEHNEWDILERFKELSTNQWDHKELTGLAEATVQLTPGHTIPNLMLLTTDNSVKELHHCFNKPSVLYFWSSESVKHYKKIHYRASDLREKYPEFNFIGINIDPNFRKWHTVVSASGYQPEHEYQFERFDVAEMKLVINSVNKSMIVDTDGSIVNGNTNLFGTDIEQQLLGYLNQ